jgi:hypothetical protein
VATELGAAAWFSLGAGVIHAATVSYQFSESTLYGLSFVAIAVGQIGWAALIVAFPSRGLAILGIVGNAAVIALWAISRTSGVPVGPVSGSPLPVGFPDAVATTLEGLIVCACVAALVVSHGDRLASTASRAWVWGGAAAVAVPLATLAVLSQAGVLTSLPPAA